jgi:hypothetical protein
MDLIRPGRAEGRCAIRIAERPAGVSRRGPKRTPGLVNETEMVLGTKLAWLRLKKPGMRSW